MHETYDIKLIMVYYRFSIKAYKTFVGYVIFARSINAF